MAVKHGADEVLAQLRKDLQSGPHSCSDLTPISGGTANYLYQGKLTAPREDGIQVVFVKHGEPFVASNPDFKLSTSRCLLEKSCLAALSTLPPHSDRICTIRTPALLEYIPETKTQIQEYLPNSLDLKSYALKYLDSSPPDSESQCRSFGTSLGTWLRHFHDWAQAPAQANLQHAADANIEMQRLKHAINYTRLVAQAKQYPAVLGDAESTFKEVAAMAKKELDNTNELQVIHGDFWSGNIILLDQQLQDNQPTTAFVVDWEMCQLGVRALDIGQMIAELYELLLFKGIRAAIWLIDGFFDGYGILNDDFGARVAIHVGTHLVCWCNVPGWGDGQQVKQVMEAGKQIILRAWDRDVDWLKQHDLRGLFRST